MNAQKAGIAFISCLAIGSGLGFYFDSFEVGGGIGLGLGVISIALFRGKRRNRSE